MPHNFRVEFLLIENHFSTSIDRHSIASKSLWTSFEIYSCSLKYWLETILIHFHFHFRTEWQTCAPESDKVQFRRVSKFCNFTLWGCKSGTIFANIPVCGTLCLYTNCLLCELQNPLRSSLLCVFFRWIYKRIHGFTPRIFEKPQIA